MTNVVPFAKPAKRIRLSRAKWRELVAAVVEREGNRCAVCRRWRRDLNGHHVLRRSQGGDDVEANVAPLCGSGTTGCHGAIEANDVVALAALREWIEGRRETLVYLCEKLGTVDRARAFLERRYPYKTDERTGGTDHAA